MQNYLMLYPTEGKRAHCKPTSVVRIEHFYEPAGQGRISRCLNILPKQLPGFSH